ncbi:hypothetical protein Ahy_B02g058184 [Arachis hypogaea]|uniref:Uncharacterized protein n=1 Tax=Arachis hypogaea TaxID=3818 RepID=A0A445AE21_ARAHY|nr:hypothetical protein Ahy_B02g058184 [Arachis hypogaea]
MAAGNQTKDLKCATHLLSDKFRNMTKEKKAIVRDLGFGGLMHIPPLRVDYQLLRELANNFKLGKNRLKTGYGDLFPEKVEYKKLSDNDKIIYRRFQDGVPFANDDKQNIARAPGPNFKMDSISERNWGGHVLTFMVKGITDYQEKKKKAINGCLFALMIIYFHLSKNKGKNRAERPPKPWIANWTKEQLVERMTAEREEILASPTSSSETETTDSALLPLSLRLKKTQRIQEENTPAKRGKSKYHTWCVLNDDCLPSRMDSRKRKQRQEESDSDSESESEPSDESEESSPAEKEKKKKKTKTTPKNERYEISSDELDEWLRENVDKSAAEGENQADLRSTEGRYVSSET